MSNRCYELAFGALLHDVGKFYQRTKITSDLSPEEKMMTPYNSNGYHSHLHSGYTSRFYKEVLKMYNEVEFNSSSHHLNEEREAAKKIKLADQIASKIDRKDENDDTDAKNNTGNYITARMHSVLTEVDLGKQAQKGVFPLHKLSQICYPDQEFECKDKAESAKEYKGLFDEFVQQINNSPGMSSEIDQYSFNKIYALLKEYTSFIPASTYKISKPSVSLFDHSKLTTAIACSMSVDCLENQRFCVLEFDVSGIQNFIFKIAEGAETKAKIAKSLRGRSLYVSIINNYIAYKLLNAFSLTQANIIFNTGGGALLLLPAIGDYESTIEKVTLEIEGNLFSIFNVDLTFVYDYVILNHIELGEFNFEKALELKQKIEEKKFNKLQKLINHGEVTFFEKCSDASVCEMCDSAIISSSEKNCKSCNEIEKVSNFFVNHSELLILYQFSNQDSYSSGREVSISIGNDKILFRDPSSAEQSDLKYEYIESINCCILGEMSMKALMVPKKDGNILSFNQITENLIGDDYGDKKMAVLKMDVDNLGAIFAFGLKRETGEDETKYVKARSLSKYLTMSRLIESFFSVYLEDICKDVSKTVNENINKDTDNESMFYINYAGGDDLVIVGAAYGIILLALEINKKFNAFVCNENIKISAGIEILHHKKPIRFAVQEAEKNLASSKLCEGKNAITLIGTTVPFDKIEGLRLCAERLKSYIKKDVISRTTLYSLMSVISDKTYDEYVRVVPKILYTIHRNTKGADMDIENIKKIFLNIETPQTLARRVLALKLAIMFTRRDKNE